MRPAIRRVEHLLKAPWVLVIVLLVVGGLALPPSPALAVVTRTVTTTDDTPPDGSCDAHCTLREAIAASADQDTIDFAVTGTIILAQGPLTISKGLNIAAPGAGTLAISGNNSSQVFIIQGAIVHIDGLTIQDGLASADTPPGCCGGGVSNFGFTRITNSVITSNSSPTDFGGGVYNAFGVSISIEKSTISGNDADAGGGVFNEGKMEVTGSTVSGNTARLGGGILNLQGALFAVNSTISGNGAEESGGGIWNLEATLGLAHVTITGNSAPEAGGVFVGAGNFQVGNTIIAGNTDMEGSPDCFVSGFAVATSQGYNLIGNDTGCNFPSIPTDLLNVDPNLGPLQDNGGPTHTHALLAGSLAIDAANPASPLLTDQRGEPRPQDGDGDGSAVSDIGAYEVEVATPQEQIQALIDTVQDLAASGVLSKGEANSLTAKLEAAQRSLDRGNTRAACGQLGAFTNEVRAMTRSGRLTVEQGQALTDAAAATMALLGC